MPEPPLQEVGPGAPARAVLKQAGRIRESADRVLGEAERRRSVARAAFEEARAEIVQQQLAALPIGRLRDTTAGGVRLGAIEAAGFTTVGAVIAAGRAGLERIHGVGRHSAWQVAAAARQLEVAMTENVRLRFDPDGRPPLQGQLLSTLRAHDAADRVTGPLRDESMQLATTVEELSSDARIATSRLRMLFAGRRRRVQARDALDRLSALLRAPETVDLNRRLDDAARAFQQPALPLGAIWQDYEERVAEYNGLLIDVGGLAPDLEAVQGFVPAELAERVHKHPLDTSYLEVSLRGYQAFGAKFALTQRKAMLGDEMGLGKTIEALAAISHLHSKGAMHFLVVCPASVLVNWAHEIARHSSMDGFRLHGAELDRNVELWVRRGGIAVTTFDTVRWLEPGNLGVDMLVVDEAHYVKNPQAQRTIGVRRWIDSSAKTLFLTGTPMENRVEEFRVLVSHLQPRIAARVSSIDGLAGATAFRSAVAPVYLRRNQEDVLEELPPRIETEEWVDLEGADFDAYCAAVASGNFMAMRQAAYLPATVSGSAKLSRLLEIVDEAAAGGRKIVVFSYFRRVLETIASSLDGLAVGPLTGSVPPVARQRLVDDFSVRHSPAVLVSQIQAGGVGLNIQAASVVILAEPQWKPTIEDQAIARCHRMGQARSVDVHRLLAENSVDQRMLEIVATKAALFDEYVRRSELKDVSPDAVDVSDVEAAKQVASQAELERRIIEVERRRLGLVEDGSSSGTPAS